MEHEWYRCMARRQNRPSLGSNTTSRVGYALKRHSNSCLLIVVIPAKRVQGIVHHVHCSCYVDPSEVCQTIGTTSLTFSNIRREVHAALRFVSIVAKLASLFAESCTGRARCGLDDGQCGVCMYAQGRDVCRYPKMSICSAVGYCIGVCHG